VGVAHFSSTLVSLTLTQTKVHFNTEIIPVQAFLMFISENLIKY